MIDKILFASNNKGKYLELNTYFEDEGIDLVFPSEKLILPENSSYMKENAFTKAKAAAKKMKMPAMRRRFRCLY